MRESGPLATLVHPCTAQDAQERLRVWPRTMKLERWERRPGAKGGRIREPIPTGAPSNHERMSA
jgi:hypothetical protein